MRSGSADNPFLDVQITPTPIVDVSCETNLVRQRFRAD